jgi:hypothetical protein
MANHARIALETVLREKKLDRTLTTSLPTLGGAVTSTAATGVARLDQVLHGGFPHGQLSEIAGPHSSGRMTIALQAMASATSRGELVAFVDTFDRLDVGSAAAAGIALERVLWIRGQAISRTDAVTDLRERTIERALKAFMLVLQAGGFGLVVLDLAEVPVMALRRLPAPTWLRVQRAVEGRDTACVLITPEPLARSAGGLTLSLTAQATWQGTGERGDAERSRVMTGLALEGRVVSPRRRLDGDLAVSARHAWTVDSRQRAAGSRRG